MNSYREAFRTIDRADFVPEELKDRAYIDAPLPIGQGQTISQPYTVNFMLELLQPKPGDNILDIGSGSGWSTSLLAYIVGEKGHVTALEIIPELCKQSIKNIAKYNFLSKGLVEAHNLNGEAGYPQNAPYDGIIVAAALPRTQRGSGAASDSIPVAWKNQLKPGGRIVAPIKNSIVKLTKNPDGKFEKEEYPGFSFVPFV